MISTEDILVAEAEKQLELEVRYRKFIDGLLPAQDAEAYVRNNVLAAIKELTEALDEISWKEWASAEFFNREAYLGELADVQLFLDNLKLLAMRGSVEDLSREFDDMLLKKIENAKRRHREGYDGVKDKCPECKRDKTAASDLLGQLLCPCSYVWPKQETGDDS